MVISRHCGTSWLSFVMSVSLSLSHWYPGYLIVSISDICTLRSTSRFKVIS